MGKRKKHVVDRYDLKLLTYDYKMLSQCYDHVNSVLCGDLTNYFEGENPDPEFKAKLYSFLVQLAHCLDALGDINWDLDYNLLYDEE